MSGNTFFIADMHFNHADIIKYCNRPFTDVLDQTEQLIANWNSVVDVEDEVWVLGDFFFFYVPDWTDQKKYYPNIERCNRELDHCRHIRSLLNGKVNLIMGNHDTRAPEEYVESGFDFVSPYPIIFNSFFILSHYPMQLSETTPYFNLYGHVHNDARYRDTSTSKCVSVEKIRYKPISLNEIIEGIKQ